MNMECVANGKIIVWTTPDELKALGGLLRCGVAQLDSLVTGAKDRSSRRVSLFKNDADEARKLTEEFHELMNLKLQQVANMRVSLVASDLEPPAGGSRKSSKS